MKSHYASGTRSHDGTKESGSTAAVEPLEIEAYLFCCGSNKCSQLGSIFQPDLIGSGMTTKTATEDSVNFMTPLVSNVLGYPIKTNQQKSKRLSIPSDGSEVLSAHDGSGPQHSTLSCSPSSGRDILSSLSATNSEIYPSNRRKNVVPCKFQNYSGLKGALAAQASSSSTGESTPPNSGNRAIICSLSSGHSHTLCCQSDGSLYAWGSNFDGQLGIYEEDSSANGGESSSSSAISSSAFAFATSANRARQSAAKTRNSNLSGTQQDAPSIEKSNLKERLHKPTRVHIPDLYHVSIGAMALNCEDSDDGDEEKLSIISPSRSGIIGHHRNQPPHRQGRVRLNVTFEQNDSRGASAVCLNPSPLASSTPHGRISARVVACGSFHTLVVTTSGALYTFGRNDHGCLGLGDAGTKRYTPTMVTEFISSQIKRRIRKNKQKHKGKGKRISDMSSCQTTDYDNMDVSALNSELPTVVSASGGLAHSLILTKDGSVYAFGRGSEGQLGDGKFGNAAEDLSHSSTGSSLVHVASCDESDSSSAGENKNEEQDSSLVGDDENNEKGTLDDLVTEEEDDDEEDVAVEDLEETPEDVSSLEDAALRSGNENVDSSGGENNNNDEDQILSEKERENYNIPHRALVPTIVEGALKKRPVIMISCSHGGHGSFAVTAKDGFGWRWGVIDKALAETDEKEPCSDHIVSQPTPLPIPLGDTSIQQEAQENRNIASTIDTSLSPSLHGAFLASFPTDVPSFPSKMGRIRSIAAGSRHLVCVTYDGEVYVMGARGAYLGLGPGCRLDWLDTTSRMLLPGNILINGVACGERHTLLSSVCGKIFACGDMTNLQLGLGIYGYPAQVASNSSYAVPVALVIDHLNWFQEQDLGNSECDEDIFHGTICVDAHSFGKFKVVEYFEELRVEAVRKKAEEAARVIAEEEEWKRGSRSLNRRQGSPQDHGQTSRLNPWQRISIGTRVVGQKLGGVVSAVTGGKQRIIRNDDEKKDKEDDDEAIFSNAVDKEISSDGLFCSLTGFSQSQVLLAAGYQSSFAHFAHETSESASSI